MMFKEKEKELSVAFTKIDALTRQLDELQKGNIVNSYNINGYRHDGELEKLRQELLVSVTRLYIYKLCFYHSSLYNKLFN